MAKISQLPDLVAPTGRERVPVVTEDGTTMGAALADLATAAVEDVVAPIRDTVSKEPRRPALGAWMLRDAAGRVAMILSRDGRRLKMLGGSVASPVSRHSSWGVTDALGNLALRLSRDGRKLQMLGGSIRSPTPSRHTAWAISDMLGRIAVRLSRDGRKLQVPGWSLEVAGGTSILRGADGGEVLRKEGGKPPVLAGQRASSGLPGYIDTAAPGATLPRPLLPDMTRWAAWGSSTIEGLHIDLAALAAEFGATFYAGGKGGEQSWHCAARSGARPALVTIAGGQVPASGAVDVAVSNIPAEANNAALAPFPGTLGGVGGTLSFVAGTFRFNRTAAGAAVPIAADTPFIPDAALTQRDAVAVLQPGKNDVTMLGEVAGVIERTAMIYDYLSPFAKCCLVLGLHVDRGEDAGSAQYARIASINMAWAARYGRAFVDLGGWLRGNRMFGATVWEITGIAPTQADTDAMTLGRLPPSLAADAAHMNTAAYSSVRWLLRQQVKSLLWYGATA